MKRFFVVTPEMVPRVMAMGGKLASYAPELKGASVPLDAVHDLLNVIDNATMEANGGRLVSYSLQSLS